jgi:hypothetical protein
MTWPGPPRWRPAPALSASSSLFRIITGHCASQISIGVTLLLCGKAIGTRPSMSRIEPRPPCGSTWTLNSPCSGVRPLTLKGQMLPEPAWACSPKAGQSAPNSTWLMLLVVLARALTGWGKVVLRIEPSGALTWIGRNRPSLLGIVGTSAHLKGYMLLLKVTL